MAWIHPDKVDLFPYSKLALFVCIPGIPSMGFQVLYLVHQLVCMDSMQLPLHSVMVLAVEDLPVTAVCRSESLQIHWASEAVSPEVEEVAMVSALAPVQVEALPLDSRSPRIRYLLATCPVHTAAAMHTDCSTSLSASSAAAFAASASSDALSPVWSVFVVQLHLPFHTLVDSSFHFQ